MMLYRFLLLAIVPACALGGGLWDTPSKTAEEFCNDEGFYLGEFGFANHECAFYCHSDGATITGVSDMEDECESNNGVCHEGQCISRDTNPSGNKKILSINYEFASKSRDEVFVEFSTDQDDAVVCRSRLVRNGGGIVCRTIPVDLKDKINVFVYENEDVRSRITENEIDLSQYVLGRSKAIAIDEDSKLRVKIQKCNGK